MITLFRDKADILWDKYWKETKKEWFKVEVLQDYQGEDDGPSLNHWLKGNKEKSIKFMDEEISKEDWVQEFKNTSFKKIRIHIVEKPYTPYVKWEIEHYKHINIPLAGERVFLIDKKETESWNIPDGDFVIFDQKRVARNYYDKSGREYKMDFYDEKDNIRYFLELRKNLFKKAIEIK